MLQCLIIDTGFLGSINKLSTFLGCIFRDMSCNLRIPIWKTRELHFELSSNKKMKRNRWMCCVRPHLDNYQVKSCCASISRFFPAKRLRSRSFNARLYKINDDCLRNVCYWFPLTIRLCWFLFYFYLMRTIQRWRRQMVKKRMFCFKWLSPQITNNVHVTTMR